MSLAEYFPSPFLGRLRLFSNKSFIAKDILSASTKTLLVVAAAHYTVWFFSATTTSSYILAFPGRNAQLSQQSDPAIRTVPMPSDANSNGDIFGGWVLSQMDIAGGTIAARRSKGRVATVAIDAMTFKRPIAVGDIVSIYGEVTRMGRTSITVHLETIVRRRVVAEEISVTEGTFVYVAIDDSGQPRPVDAT
tara:strand:- start:3412 stop:3987 length:576 start_codon:yes stop_codon:yes gene_type:complete